MTRLRTILLLALISLIVTLSLQYTADIANIPTSKGDRSEDNVDYSINNFTLVSMNPQGQTQYHLSAETMKHFQSDDSTKLQNPRIELHDETKNKWVISALMGDVSPHGKTITFMKQVRITHSGKTDQDQLTINTESLTIKPEQHLVSTRKQIHLTGKGLSVKSNGLKANTQKGLIQLLSKVRGVYENR